MVAGTYEMKSSLDSYYSKNAQGVTMISRRANLQDDNLKKVPGPGTYDLRLNTKRSAPHFKIGTSTRD